LSREGQLELIKYLNFTLEGRIKNARAWRKTEQIRLKLFKNLNYREIRRSIRD